MKKALIILLSSVSSLAFSQDIDFIDIPKYKAAYEYIREDSVMCKMKDLYVSDSIIDLNRMFFYESLQNYPILRTTIDSLYRFTTFESFKSESLKELFGKLNSKSGNILFFSLIEKNTLRADLFLNRLSLKEFRSLLSTKKIKF